MFLMVVAVLFLFFGGKGVVCGGGVLFVVLVAYSISICGLEWFVIYNTFGTLFWLVFWVVYREAWCQM